MKVGALPVRGWMATKAIEDVLRALAPSGRVTRFVGGAVRDSLMEKPVRDVDLATECLPQETAKLLEAAGIACALHGITHGSVMALLPKRAIEITTLRVDVRAYGRHADVAFTRAWREDAMRRDFTINALYADPDGALFDWVGGLEDIASARVRFIGDAEARVREDYLRILRFFRFHAHYARHAPDDAALAACARQAAGLDGIARERVLAELTRLLEAPAPWEALAAMRAVGIASRVVPEWCLLPDSLRALAAAEAALARPVDPYARLAALLPNAESAQALCARWPLALRARRRLLAAQAQPPSLDDAHNPDSVRRNMARGGQAFAHDRALIALARLAPDTPRASLAPVRAALNEPAPRFPLSGRDALALGATPGPAIGRALRAAEAAWLKSGCLLPVADLQTILQQQLNKC